MALDGDSGETERMDEAGAPAPRTALIVAAFLAVYVIWGSTYLAIRFAVETLPPFLMASARFLVAGGLLYAVRRRRAGPPERRHWAAAAVTGGLMLCGGNGGVVWAEQFVASDLTALIVATVPLWMVLFDAARPGGERPARLTLVGLVVGFAGVAVLVEPGRGIAGGGVPWGPALVLLGASASWAAGSLLSRHLPAPKSHGQGTAMQMLAGGAALLVLGAASGELGELSLAGASARSLASLAYLIVFGSLVAYSAYVWLLRVASPARVSTYAFVNPVVAVLLGWALAGEPLDLRVALATVLVALAVGAVIVGRGDRAGGGLRPPWRRARGR